MIKYLEWDSSFFGYPVGIIELINNSDEDYLNKLFEQASTKYKLLYVFVPEYIELTRDFCERLNLDLVDQKIIYKKQLSFEFTYNRITDIKSIMHSYFLPFKNLALQSGIYSRYKIDKHFVNDEFERLYEEWLRKSLDGTIADECYAYYKTEKPVGLVTIKKNVLDVSIGIIAVNSAFRGFGIGTKLLDTVSLFAFNNNYTTVSVATQSKNYSACKFYEKNGFHVKQVISIYHYWSDKYNPL
ncbi:GNAT family N-acetyltransferase [Spirosoma aerolatum]|uniref:GNAT family N-acetyltransferase n=1 Tax=Spirosoma aerolatum TaxID=1211326 RepID=UPI0009AC95D1|nr:GNAT family N-acetyltransferase [Spirosoma aerolatum]